MDALIPIVGIVFVIGPISALVFSYTPIGRAVVKRLGGTAKAGSDDRLAELQDEIESLRELFTHQDGRVEDLYDRLDFAERLLASKSQMTPESEKVATPVSSFHLVFDDVCQGHFCHITREAGDFTGPVAEA